MKPAVVLCVGLLCTSVFAAHRVQRTLSFEERVNAQIAIARVYYAHQDGAIKPFNEAVPRSVVEARVRNTLDQSAALSLYWKTAVTDEALERELARMTGSSRLPERLSELFEALGDDPFLIKECLVRPVLVERLTHNFQAMDPSMHLKERSFAEALRRQLANGAIDPASAHPNRTVSDLALDDSEAGSSTTQRRGRAPMSREQFLQRRSELPGSVGQVSDVAESRGDYSISVILSETATNVRVATYTVRKMAWDSWWSNARVAVAGAAVQAVASREGAQLLSKLKREALRGLDCGEQGWHNGQLDDLHLAYPNARAYHTAVWTGSEMLIFGGLPGSFTDDDPGLRYDPATDTWALMSLTNAPQPRASHTAVWTGTSMIVWGGSLQLSAGVRFTGGRYDPNTDTWTRVSTQGAPSARYNHSAVWTGSEMVVWGGAGPGAALQTGGRYDPVTDTWRPTSTVGAPPPMSGHAALWTGSRMLVSYGASVKIYDPLNDTWSPTSYGFEPVSGNSAVWTGHYLVIWGGTRSVRCGPYGDYCPQDVNQGARYNPATDRWSSTSVVGAPSPRSGHHAVWTGTEMLIWGGYGPGGRYNPDTDSWTPMATLGAPESGRYQTAVWADHQMIVWGDVSLFRFAGGRYDPATDSWTPTSAGYAPYGQSVAWTGSQMLVWGGFGGASRRYDPATDSWSAMATNGEPSARSGHTAVWSGSSMLVWGGVSESSTRLNSGGRYDPAIDAWSDLSAASAPAARDLHSALWTGSEMFVWGGKDGTQFLNTGGRYDPRTDTWEATSTSGAPIPRGLQTAVWTGELAIVWGGSEWNGNVLQSGARYDPQADSWTPTSLNEAPEARYQHTAVWVDGQMIVWGGRTMYSGYANAGARYDPVQDSWTPTSLTAAPGPRDQHTAVATGNAMIVYGGQNVSGASSRSTTGFIYEPVSDRWTKMSKTGEPRLQYGLSSIWTGTAMIVWDGSRGGLYVLSTPLDADCDGDGVAVSGGDCDDSDGSAYPGAPQVCDGINNDCLDFYWPDGRSNAARESDYDQDGVRVCQGDCDDRDPSTYPGALQLCDGLNNDCNDPSWPSAPGEADADRDGVRICQGDCDDSRSSVGPGWTDYCDGLDNDCDAIVDDGAEALCGVPPACYAVSCEGVDRCVLSYAPGPCDDANPCTTGDSCESGACVGVVQIGASCDDRNPCTIDDACDSSAGCRGSVTVGAPCDDNNSCTESDTCGTSGYCYGLSLENGVPCEPSDRCLTGNICEWGYCRSDAYRGCQDADACNGDEACDPATGACLPAVEPLDCDDGNECTADGCDPLEGCVYTPTTLPCDDGDACTVGDVCRDGACLWGPVADCDDGTPCTDDSCDFQTGCVHANNTHACDDGNACTIGDACGGGGCSGGSPVVCSQLDQCHTAGICDPASGTCSHPIGPDGVVCDDSDLCTTGETCRTGTCTPAFSGLNEPKPRTVGYYKRLCDGPHSADQFTDADAICVAAVARTFAGISTVADLCAELSGPGVDLCDISERELMILALNICRARVCTAQSIDSQCGGKHDVGQSLAESDDIFRSPSRNAATCALASCLDEEINTGRALELNTLTVRRDGAHVRLGWSPPHVDERAGHYVIWRRERGSLAPLAKIGTTTETTFLDVTSGSGAYDYEITAATD